jgi:hypothetical protein
VHGYGLKSVRSRVSWCIMNVQNMKVSIHRELDNLICGNILLVYSMHVREACIQLLRGIHSLYGQ